MKIIIRCEEQTTDSFSHYKHKLATTDMP